MKAVTRNASLTAPLMRKIGNIPSFFKYYKKTIVTTVVAILSMVLVFGIAFCADPTWDKAGGLYDACYMMIDQIITQQGVASTLEKVSVGCTDSTVTIAGNVITNMTMVKELNEFCVLLAIAVASALFFISLVNMREQDITDEEFIKKLIMLGVTFVLCYNAKNICYYITNIGTGIAEKVANTAVDANTSETADTIKKAIFDACYESTSGAGVFEKIGLTVSNAIKPFGYVLQLFLPWIIMWAVSALVNFTCWARAFEIIIMATFSPLAFAEMSDSGRFGQGSGARFVKNMCALAISGAIILFIMALCNNVSSDIIRASVTSADNFLSATGSIAVIGLAEVGLVLKAQNIAKTVCGIG